MKTLPAWLKRPDLKLLLAAFAATGAAWSFLMLANEVREGETQHLDELILRSLRHPGDLGDALGPPGFEDAVRDVTALGSFAVLFGVTVVVAGYLALARRYRTLAFVVASIWCANLLNTLLKRFYERPRPTVVPHLTQVTAESFPSGHSMMAAVVYLTLAAVLATTQTRNATRLYTVAVALVLTAAVGASRVYLGVHYPSDVLAGWAAGSAWAALWWAVARAAQIRQGSSES